MGKRYPKYLRKIRKVSDSFIEELILAADLQVCPHEGVPPSGQSIRYENEYSCPGIGYALRPVYAFPLYLNVRQGSKPHQQILEDNREEILAKMMSFLEQEGINYILRESVLIITL